MGCLLAQGALPGDLVVTRALQEVLGVAPRWAEFVTSSAKFPMVWLTLLLATALVFPARGWRAAAVPALAFAGVTLLDVVLRALVFAPKPDPGLVSVATASASSGFPSTFGLVYGALFGPALFTARGPRGAHAFAIAAAVGLLVAGATARIVLGGHWTSQMLASLLLAFSLVLALQQAIGRPAAVAAPRQKPPSASR